MSSKLSVGVLGATSYTGLELVRLLAYHPNVRIEFLSSQSSAGKKFSESFPEIKGIHDAMLISPQEAADKPVECIFACLPHAVSGSLLMPYINKGIRVIDLSADFRIRDPIAYEKWYATRHPSPERLAGAVYGLPEHYRCQIKTAQIIANPGCYPTSILLPLLPLLKEPTANVGDVIIADSKSGVSGAGRTLKLTSHFVEVYEDICAYNVGRSHRHIAEIDQELSRAARRPMRLSFTPHLIPVNRGILSAVYFTTPWSAAQCLEYVAKRYEKEPFVRMRQPGDMPHVKYVAHTNFCDITFAGGTEGCPMIAISAIDNLIKGASGQAVQNMNIMFGFEETAGLLR